MVFCVFLHLPSSLVGLVQQDTVIDAGKYDGALGIVAAIGAVKALKTEGKLQQFPRPIEVGLLNFVSTVEMESCPAASFVSGSSNMGIGNSLCWSNPDYCVQ